MRVKIDENLPEDLVELLAARGFDADSAGSEGLSGHDDASIWTAAQRDGRLLLTQDLDFSDIRRFKPGSHAGILLLRLHDPSRRRLIQRTTDLFESAESRTWAGCVVVATEHKVRVRKP